MNVGPNYVLHKFSASGGLQGKKFKTGIEAWTLLRVVRCDVRTGYNSSVNVHWGLTTNNCVDTRFANKSLDVVNLIEFYSGKRLAQSGLSSLKLEL